MYNILKTTNIELGNIPNLQFRATALGTEDLSGTVKHVSSFFIDKVKDTSVSISNTVDRLITMPFKLFNSNYSELSKNNKLVENIQSDVKFTKIANIQIPVTLGMRQDLYTSVNELHNLKDILEYGVYDAVKEADGVVSKILSSRDFRGSSRMHKDSKEFNKIIEQLHGTLSLLIDENGVKDRMAIKELLPNLTSLGSINKKLTELNEIVKPDNFNKVVKVLANIKDNVDILHSEYLKEVDDVKKERLIELGYYLEAVGKMVTVSVSLVHLISQYSDTYKHILEKLEENI